MGLFSKKNKWDLETSDANKAAMRVLFNKNVPDGDSYKIVYGCSQSLKSMDFLIIRSETVTVASLIVGYRDSDMSIVLAPTVPELDECGEPRFYKNTEIKKAKIVSGEYVIYHQGGMMAGYTQFSVVAENGHEDDDEEEVSAYIYQPDESEDFSAFWKRYAKG